MNDTNPKIRDMQISLFRDAGLVKRAMRMRALSRSVIRLSRRAIARAHPEYNERDVDLLFVRLHYGKNIADRLAKYLEQRGIP